MTAYPGSRALTFDDDEFRCSMRRRLGMPVRIEGPDVHGHRRLAESIGGSTNVRHTSMIAAWRQVFVEAGGQVPDRNVERMLWRTHINVPEGDRRRMDLLVSGLQVALGQPLFCDVTVVSPITRSSGPRLGTSNAGGSLLRTAERDNDRTYAEVSQSGMGMLLCLGHEVYGRMTKQAVDILPKLATAKAQFVHPRLRRGTALSYLSRWSGLLSIALQKSVATALVRGQGADLPTSLSSWIPALADLPLQ